MSDGETYIATLSTPSRLYKLTGADAQPVFTSNQYRIEGFAADDDGGFVFTDGTGGVYRTSDFETCETLIQGDRKFSRAPLSPTCVWEADSSPADRCARGTRVHGQRVGQHSECAVDRPWFLGLRPLIEMVLQTKSRSPAGVGPSSAILGQ